MRWKFIGIFLGLCMASLLLMALVGHDFFPAVDAGQFRLHMRVRTGTRIEETARMADLVEQTIRKVIPPDQITSILDNLGLPYSGINTSYSNNGTFGTGDAEILVRSMPGITAPPRIMWPRCARSYRAIIPAWSSSSSRRTSSARY